MPAKHAQDPEFKSQYHQEKKKKGMILLKVYVKNFDTRRWLLTPIILASQEAGIRRITV
jgi:hypothetical protein